MMNGKNVTPIENYHKPSDTLALQNLINQFDRFIICHGILKKTVDLCGPDVWESFDRWWHPHCSIILWDTNRYDL